MTYTCLVCGEIKTEAIPANADDHTWDEGKVIVEPTTELEGVRQYTCTECGETKTEIIDIIIPEYVKGDPNGDDEVDVKDVIALRRNIAGGYGVDVYDLAADVNKDGDVDVRDIVILRRFVAGGYGVVLK